MPSQVLSPRGIFLFRFLHVHYVVFVSFLLNTPLLRRFIRAERVSWAHAILFMGLLFYLS